jgi:hypothetical protein
VVSGWKGIAESVLAEAGIVVSSDGLASIPYRDSGGALLRMRYRTPERSWWGPGEETYPFGLERLPHPGSRYPSYCALIVAEGESDSLAAREHFDLYDDEQAVEYFVLGMPGARSFRPEWQVVAAAFDLVYVIGDGDEAGHAFAWDVRRHVPWARPVVCPDGRDLRDLLQAEGLAPVRALLRAADADADLEYALLLAPDSTHHRAKEGR